MKPIELALTPTRNRRLNEVTGMVLLVAASLLFLALASYHPTDPSLDTVAASQQVQNWTGLIGATTSDLLLQVEGVAAFFLPLVLGALGLTWLRSQPAGSPSAKVSGALLYLVFAPALFGLLPGHLRWMHALPLEGLTGRLVVDSLQHYLNFAGRRHRDRQHGGHRTLPLHYVQLQHRPTVDGRALRLRRRMA